MQLGEPPPQTVMIEPHPLRVARAVRVTELDVGFAVALEVGVNDPWQASTQIPWYESWAYEDLRHQLLSGHFPINLQLKTITVDYGAATVEGPLGSWLPNYRGDAHPEYASTVNEIVLPGKACNVTWWYYEGYHPMVGEGWFRSLPIRARSALNGSTFQFQTEVAGPYRTFSAALDTTPER